MLAVALIVFNLILPLLQTAHAQAASPSAAKGAGPVLVEQLGHIYVVSSVAFSPNGQWALTGSHDNTARLWHAESGRELRSFQGHSDWVRCVAFSADSNQVLTGSADKTARLWEAQTGKPLVRFQGHSKDIISIAISLDGSLVATGSEDHTARLWDARTGKELFILFGHSGFIRSVAFSPDGRWLLTGSDDHTARLWDTRTGKESQQLKGHSAQVTKVAFRPDGQAVTASWDKTIRFWDALAGKELRRFQRASNYPFIPDPVAFSADGRLVASGSYEGRVRLWSMESGQEVGSFQAHAKEISALDFSPDGKSLLTGSHDDTARLWEVQTGRQLASFQGYSGWVSSASFSADGRRILTRTVFAGADNYTAHLWDIGSGKQQLRFPHSVELTNSMFSPDGQQVLTATWDGIAHLWNAQNGEKLRRFVGFKGDASGMAFSAAYSLTGDRVVTAGVATPINIWDARTGQELKSFAARGVYAVTFSPDGQRILASSQDKTVRLYDAENGREVMKFAGHTKRITSAAFSPDGKSILTTSEDHTACLWDARTGQLKRRFMHPDEVSSAAFSPTHPWALTGCQDNRAYLWDIDSGAKIREFVGHTGLVWSVAFSPNGKMVLTGSGDHTARLWATDSGQELCRLITFNDNTWAVVDPRGRFDTNNLEEIRGLHWIMLDDPMRPLPIEIFMRDYYEPQLLTKIVNAQPLGQVRELSRLNRTQPEIEIQPIIPRGDDPDRVTVEVKVARGRSQSQRDARGRLLDTGVYDLRLFRDGKLVGQWPRRQTAKLSLADYDQELRDWQQTSQINLGQAGKQIIPFEVRLPRQAGLKQVEFSAYAFNGDRVKSATSRKSLVVRQGRAPAKGRAYLITVGVNGYQNPEWNLKFAANDARLAREVLSESLARLGDFSSVVQISLISDYRPSDGVITQKQATKANFKTALDLLSGKPVGLELIREIAGADQIRKVTPDDFVLIFFASHGVYANNEYFFLPYDIGPNHGKDITADLLKRSISSDELSLWLRDVDAGEMVLIVDACQSEALVKTEGFKAGPMGSRGLGQLAYDKGMRILAATQKDNVAIERDELRHGLLTYALIHDGIQARQADSPPEDHKITLSEWLNYGVMRVPALESEINQGKINDFGMGRGRGRPRVVYIGKRDGADGLDDTQRPVLFDFIRKPSSPTLVKLTP